MVGDTCLGRYNASFVQAHSQTIRPHSHRDRLRKELAMRVICPVCKNPPEISSLTMYLYVHFCDMTQTMWYTNGILWSTDHTQITGVSREPRNYHPSPGA